MSPDWIETTWREQANALDPRGSGVGAKWLRYSHVHAYWFGRGSFRVFGRARQTARKSKLEVVRQALTGQTV